MIVRVQDDRAGYVLLALPGYTMAVYGGRAAGTFRGTISDFGGNSAKEYGPLLKILYPNTGFTTVRQYDDYNSGLISNPCPAS